MVERHEGRAVRGDRTSLAGAPAGRVSHGAQRGRRADRLRLPPAAGGGLARRPGRRPCRRARASRTSSGTARPALASTRCTPASSCIASAIRPRCWRCVAASCVADLDGAGARLVLHRGRASGPIEPLFTELHVWRARDADFEVGGRRYGVFAHDWRVENAEQWIRLKAERAWRIEHAPPPGATGLATSQLPAAAPAAIPAESEADPRMSRRTSARPSPSWTAAARRPSRTRRAARRSHS